jgi:hypothetical protein
MIYRLYLGISEGERIPVSITKVIATWRIVRMGDYRQVGYCNLQLTVSIIWLPGSNPRNMSG